MSQTNDSDTPVNHVQHNAQRNAQSGAETRTPLRRGRMKLLLVLCVCAAPLIAALLAYYVWPPSGRTNYGTLIEPQRPLPEAQQLGLTHLDGRPFDLRSLRGKWVMLQVHGGDCLDPCVQKLFSMRQIRLMTGKERERVERVWLISDQAPLSTLLMREYDGTWMLRGNLAALENFLPHETTTQLSDHLWLIDPLGNLMLRFPQQPDPKKMHKDLSRLLYASKGWVQTSPASARHEQ